jgi:hypothetical protein
MLLADNSAQAPPPAKRRDVEETDTAAVDFVQSYPNHDETRITTPIPTLFRSSASDLTSRITGELQFHQLVSLLIRGSKTCYGTLLRRFKN